MLCVLVRFKRDFSPLMRREREQRSGIADVEYLVLAWHRQIVSEIVADVKFLADSYWQSALCEISRSRMEGMEGWKKRGSERRNRYDLCLLVWCA